MVAETGASGANAGSGLGGASDVAAGAGGASGEAAQGGQAAQGGEAAQGGAGSAKLLLFNTGVDDNGAVLAGGSVDPHYTLVQSADQTLPGPDAIVVSNIAAGFWAPESDTSKWIAPSANQVYPGPSPCNASGVYVWRTTFDLAGRDPSTFKIAGSWAADNTGSAIRLNGVGVTITQPGYNPLVPFVIATGFIAGKNTLDFEVTDTGCPNGLRVELSEAVDGT